MTNQGFLIPDGNHGSSRLGFYFAWSSLVTLKYEHGVFAPLNPSASGNLWCCGHEEQLH